MDLLPLIKVAVAFVVLALAARSDWKTREASDAYWMVIGTVGMVLLVAQVLMDGADALYLLVLIPITVFFLDIFWERKGMFEDGINLLPLGLYAAGFAVMGLLIFRFGTDPYLWQLLIIPIMFFVFIILYQFDVIKGGADAKALIALAILLPAYPVFYRFPLIPPTEIGQIIFPFPLLILFNAALLVIAVPVALFAYNLGKGNVRLPAMFFGYRLPVDEARKKFVWPMEYVKDGEIRLSVFPRSLEEGKDPYDELKAAGATNIWVTPKIPFLIPIAASVLFSALVGNVIFLMLH